MLCGSTVNTVESFCFWGPFSSHDLKWETPHQLPHQESTPEDVLLTSAKEVQPAHPSVGALLLCCCGAHPHLLHHRLEFCCHSQGQGQG